MKITMEESYDGCILEANCKICNNYWCDGGIAIFLPNDSPLGDFTGYKTKEDALVEATRLLEIRTNHAHGEDEDVD